MLFLIKVTRAAICSMSCGFQNIFTRVLVFFTENFVPPAVREDTRLGAQVLRAAAWVHPTLVLGNLLQPAGPQSKDGPVPPLGPASPQQ